MHRHPLQQAGALLVVEPSGFQRSSQPPSRLLVCPDGAPEPDERGDQAHTDHSITGGEAVVKGDPHVGHYAAQLGEHRVVVDHPLVGVSSFAELSQPARHARSGGRSVGRLGVELLDGEGSKGVE